MKKALIVSIFILTIVAPATSHAYYSEEQYRIDVKQYLDLQKSYQQKEEERRQGQAIIDTLNSNYSSISRQYDIDRLQKQLEQQKVLSAEQDKQIAELLRLQTQMSLSNHITPNTTTPAEKSCSEFIKGASDATGECMCPDKMQIKYDGSIYYCAQLATLTKKTTSKDKYSELELDTSQRETTAHTGIKPFDYSTLAQEPITPPVEKVGKIRSFFHSVQNKITSFWSWVF